MANRRPLANVDGRVKELPSGDLVAATLGYVSATARILGRATASAGAVEELTAAQVRSMLGLGIRYAIKSSDQSWTSDTTLADVTDLGWSVEANKTYLFEFFLDAETNSTPDMKLNVALPSGEGGVQVDFMIYSIFGGSDFRRQYVTGSSLASNLATDTSRQLIILSGFAAIGATAGDLQLQAAQGTSSATPVTIYANSIGRITEVA